MFSIIKALGNKPADNNTKERGRGSFFLTSKNQDGYFHHFYLTEDQESESIRHEKAIKTVQIKKELKC